MFIPKTNDDKKLFYIETAPSAEPTKEPTVMGGIGTIFIDGEFIPDGAPSVYKKKVDIGFGEPRMYDRRDNRFSKRNAY